MAAMLTAGNIANETGIPETTVRRYLVLFDDFFLSRKVGRATKYDVSSIELIKKIYYLYADGLSSEDIRSKLSLEESYSPSAVGDSGGSSDGMVVVADNLPPALINQISAVVEAMVDKRTKELQNRIEELEQAQAELAADKESLAETIKHYDKEQTIAINELNQRINERDAKLIETMRGMMEKKKMPWWKHLLGT